MSRYEIDPIKVFDTLNDLLYSKDEQGNYIIEGSNEEYGDGGDFLMMRNFLDKISQSVEFMKKLKFALLNVNLSKLLECIKDDDSFNEITVTKNVGKLRNILIELDEYYNIFDLSINSISSDSIRCIRHVFMSKKLTKMRDELNCYSFWKNFVVNILSDDSRCNFSDSKMGMKIVNNLIANPDPLICMKLSQVSSVESALELLDNNFYLVNDVETEYTGLIESLYDGSIKSKELRNIIQFTQLDMDTNRSIQFSKIIELIDKITSDEFSYLTHIDKFNIREFVNKLLYESYDELLKMYFKLNNYVNNRYIKIRNLFDEYLDRRDPEYIDEEFVIDNKYNKSDIITKGRIKLIPICDSLSNVKTKFGVYIDDKLYFDPIDSIKVSLKVLREMTNVSDIYYNRKKRSERNRNKIELMKLIN